MKKRMFTCYEWVLERIEKIYKNKDLYLLLEMLDTEGEVAFTFVFHSVTKIISKDFGPHRRYVVNRSIPKKPKKKHINCYSI